MIHIARNKRKYYQQLCTNNEYSDKCVKISFLNNVYNTEFHYMGTKAEWAKVSIAEKPKKAIVVKCTDGEITVEKRADN